MATIEPPTNTESKILDGKKWFKKMLFYSLSKKHQVINTNNKNNNNNNNNNILQSEVTKMIVWNFSSILYLLGDPIQFSSSQYELLENLYIF